MFIHKYTDLLFGCKGYIKKNQYTKIHLSGRKVAVIVANPSSL